MLVGSLSLSRRSVAHRRIHERRPPVRKCRSNAGKPEKSFAAGCSGRRGATGCLHEGGRPWYLLHPLLRWRLHSYVCEALFRWQNTTHRAFLDRLAHQVGVSNWRCCNVGWCRDDFRFNHPCKFVHFEQVSGGKVCMYAELPARLFQLSGESGVVHRLLMASAVHHRHVRLSEHSGMQHHARDNGNHDTHTR